MIKTNLVFRDNKWCHEVLEDGKFQGTLYSEKASKNKYWTYFVDKHTRKPTTQKIEFEGMDDGIQYLKRQCKIVGRGVYA